MSNGVASPACASANDSCTRPRNSECRCLTSRKTSNVAVNNSVFLRMECLQVAAVGLGSNKVTAEQLDKITRFARQLANNQVLLLPDCDEDGRLDSKICSGDSAKPNFRYDLRGQVRLIRIANKSH